MIKKETAKSTAKVTEATAKRAPKKVASVAKKNTDNKAATVTSSVSVPQKKQEKEEIISPLVILKIWLDGWKKAFTLKGRSSRFELWIFMLVNSILTIGIQLQCSYTLSDRYLRYAHARGLSLNMIENHIILAEILLYAVFIIPLFPLGSLLIRRMHDIGRVAWQNCLEPAFMSMVLVWVLFLSFNYINDLSYSINMPLVMSLIALLAYVSFIISIYALGYYLLKFLITTMFYRGMTKNNAFGECAYNTDAHEEWALNLSSLYFLFIGTITLLYLVSIFL